MLQGALDSGVRWVAARLRMVAGRSSMSCCRADAPRAFRGTEAVRRDHGERYRRSVWIAAVARCGCQRGCREAGSRHRSNRFAWRAANPATGLTTTIDVLGKLLDEVLNIGLVVRRPLKVRLLAWVRSTT